MRKMDGNMIWTTWWVVKVEKVKQKEVAFKRHIIVGVIAGSTPRSEIKVPDPEEQGYWQWDWATIGQIPVIRCQSLRT
jgi:hypothetical protein